MCWNLLKNLFKKKQVEEQKTVIIPDKIERNWGAPPPDIDNSEWEPLNVKPTGIVVRWREKYGCAMEEHCIGLWVNKTKTQYMLTWKDGKKIYLIKENIDSIEAVDE